jgi:DNA polymerase III subunit gamma/tau
MKIWETLYNKYRPRNFQEFIGQEHIITILRNSLKKNYIHHGIILSGMHGTGKTSLSLIFSAAINCFKKNDIYFPCGECENCHICFDSHYTEDILQIDGATHTGVENMRAILEDTMFQPKYLKYKIIIIDEVHMLSKSAFNSILKTLENPPANVKFIFCTTEKHKIIDTIISRCLLLELHKISEIHIQERLKEISKKETICITQEAIQLISIYSKGSLRDALSILENLYLLSLDTLISKDVIETHLRILNEKNIIEIYIHCLEGNWQQALDQWQIYYEKGISSLEFLKKLSMLICNLLKQKTKNTDVMNINNYEDILNHFDLNNSILIGHWQVCLYGIKNIYYGEELVIDMILIMLTLMEDNLSFEELQKIFPGIKLIS